MTLCTLSKVLYRLPVVRCGFFYHPFAIFPSYKPLFEVLLSKAQQFIILLGSAHSARWMLKKAVPSCDCMHFPIFVHDNNLHKVRIIEASLSVCVQALRRVEPTTHL